MAEKRKTAMVKGKKTDSGTSANLGFEAKLWQAADALRNNMDAAEYKHVVLGLIFLKYISDAFEAKHVELESQRKQGADPEDPDEYRAASIFWVPKEARWSHLKADYVLANPPFNDSDWRGKLLKEDKRWAYGGPPEANANFAWVQHFIHHLAPIGIAGFVLANGSTSSNQSGEGEIRKAIIEADLLDCMVALPGQLFYSTQIPVCLWFLARNKKNTRFRDRRGETLFIDARKMGTMVDRVHRELTDEDIAKIAGTYHSWRGDKGKSEYADVSGFCKATKLDDIRKHSHVLTPGRYVGAEAQEDDREPFEEKMKRLTATLRQQTVEGRRLDDAIRRNLKELGYEL